VHYTPQELLDQIHAINFPNIVKSPQQADAFRLASEKLNLIKKRVKQEVSAIEATWDGRNPQQAIAQKLQLAPYLLLRDVIDQLDIGLSELKMGQQPTSFLSLGRWIVGTNFSDWKLVDDQGFFDWQYQQMLAEFKLTHRKIEQAQERLHVTQNRMGKFRLYGVALGGSLGCIGSALFLALRSPTSVLDASPNVSLCLCLPGILIILVGIFGAGLTSPDYKEKQQKVRQAKEMIKKLEASVEKVKRPEHIVKIRTYILQAQAMLSEITDEQSVTSS
jgi:hypothetical protein